MTLAAADRAAALAPIPDFYLPDGVYERLREEIAALRANLGHKPEDDPATWATELLGVVGLWPESCRDA